ncbi:RB-associated KRAB zinc finger protein isoform X3 [Hydra vulgaris]|uniref:RB-associated KRAB zinc finger protein isoform X3 n=1 Tax=Hydra vulgaris TaxID=6087 RepID=UPI0006416266|nr:RB-associated KRAB zinc finger protein isoform X3 [Hydra vulgaris]
MADASNLNQGVQTYIEKTLYDADDFLANFSMLREENEHLKKSNENLQQQLEKLQQEVQQLHIDKQNLENQLLREREQHKEALWNTRSDIQRIQEERLEWKEKYLDVCMKGGSKQEPVINEKQKTWKFKQSLLSTGTIPESIADEFYSNLSSTFGLNENEDQPVTVVVIKKSNKQQEQNYEVLKRSFDYSGGQKRSNAIDSFENEDMSITTSEDAFNKFKQGEYSPQKKVYVKLKRQFSEEKQSYVTSSGSLITAKIEALSPESPNEDITEEVVLVDNLSEIKTDSHTERKETFPENYTNKLEQFIERVNNIYGEIAYECSFCKKSFSSLSAIRRHIPIHLDDRPYVCNFCGQAFKVKIYLDSHIQGKHSTAKLSCNICGRPFKWRATLYTHMKNCTNKN